MAVLILRQERNMIGEFNGFTIRLGSPCRAGSIPAKNRIAVLDSSMLLDRYRSGGVHLQETEARGVHHPDWRCVVADGASGMRKVHNQGAGDRVYTLRPHSLIGYTSAYNLLYGRVVVQRLWHDS